MWMINMYRLVGGVLCAILALIGILNFINSMTWWNGYASLNKIYGHKRSSERVAVFKCDRIVRFLLYDDFEENLEKPRQRFGFFISANRITTKYNVICMYQTCPVKSINGLYQSSTFAMIHT